VTWTPARESDLEASYRTPRRRWPSPPSRPRLPRGLSPNIRATLCRLHPNELLRRTPHQHIPAGQCSGLMSAQGLRSHGRSAALLLRLER
jgi:hypothetical protein